jgi:hypothetical protein
LQEFPNVQSLLYLAYQTDNELQVKFQIIQIDESDSTASTYLFPGGRALKLVLSLPTLQIR